MDVNRLIESKLYNAIINIDLLSVKQFAAFLRYINFLDSNGQTALHLAADLK